MANNKKPSRQSGISAAKRAKLKAAAKNMIGAISTRKLVKKFDASQGTVIRIPKAEGLHGEAAA